MNGRILDSCRTTAVIVLLSLPSVTCGQKSVSEPPAKVSATVTPVAPPPAAAPAVAAPAVAVAAAPEPAVSAASPGIIASSDGETMGFRVEIEQLKRDSGGTVTLKVIIVNDTDHDMSDYNAYRDNEGGTIDGVHLIDAGNKKKYFVVRDSEGHCVCSRKLDRVAAKSRLRLWAKFPAPPDTVQKISVEIPHFAPMDDVPISR